jgi:GrpB-like predicted nucleotidyltransferase (UPF0157 family)/cytidylate kinase
MTERVILVPYDPDWPRRFEEERGVLAAVFSGTEAVIEHVGSTAVPGLGAKPVIDVMIGVRALAEVEARIPELEAAGYEYVPEHEQQLPNRRYFHKPRHKPRTVHLHCVVKGSDFWIQHLAFRDYLRAHPDTASAYYDLKRDLASRMPRSEYTEAKSSFIQTAVASALQEKLRHVYWIGGASAAGKSTIARRIAAQHGLSLYATDEMMADHARRSSPADCPLLHRFIAMDMDERWVNRSPKRMLETFHWFSGEGFNFIIEDVLHLAWERGVVVEGFRLLPHLVKPLLSVPTRAVWLLPTSDFRRSVIESRGGSKWGFLAKTSDPDSALRNLLDRDRMFTNVLREETSRLGLPAIEVDTTMTEDDLARRVTDLFAA